MVGLPDDFFSDLLGIDMGSGEGEWPPGLLVHTAGATENGWAVFEVWESQEAQERFMNERLAPALAEMTYVKFGLAGCAPVADWPNRLRAAMSSERLSKRSRGYATSSSRFRSP